MKAGNRAVCASPDRNVVAWPASESVGYIKSRQLERRRLHLCFGCLALVGLLLVSLVVLALFFAGCDEAVHQEIASPRGQYIAQIVIIGCGGAAGSVDSEVRVRLAGEDPDSKGETVFDSTEGPYGGLAIAWAGEERLLIEYPCEGGLVDTKHYRWRDLPISYRCLDSSIRQDGR